MESKRKNCNNIMNKFVVSVAMILVTLLFGLFFITPSTPKANAMTKKNLISNSIHFVSAKTKIRRVDGYYNTQLEGHNGNTYYQFYSYLYNYKANLPNMYQELDGNNYSCDNANVILGGMSDDSHLHSYIQYDSSPSTEQPSYDWDNNYIPYNVTHFDSNASSSDICLEEVFYDEIDDGDYVLLNNYHALEQSKYDVENFYVGLGSAYDGTYETNYITDIVVEGKLYCVDGRT